MKIGTLTFHRACNYGGALQCFALVKALRNMGYDAEVIDYRNPAIEKSYALISTASIKSFISSVLHLPQSLKKRRNFRNFSKSFVPTSHKVYKSANELSNQYDVCVIGSDQVWSKRINHGFDPVYWGNFEDKKITYAASMGTDHDFTESDYNQIQSYLKNFDCISTREDSLREELSPFTEKEIQTVVDPTLLISLEDYKTIAFKPQEENYVLYYQMEYHPQSKRFVSHIAKQLGCKVITIMGPNEEYEGIEHVHKKVSDVNVQEFVGYILYAKCVIASSFHGTALPIAMRKDFYFLANYQTDRSENLLRHVGALERMKKSEDIISFTSVNYGRVETLLNKYIDESMLFLTKSI